MSAAFAVWKLDLEKRVEVHVSDEGRKSGRWTLERTRDISKSPQHPEIEFSWRNARGNHLVRETVPGTLRLPEGARMRAIGRMLLGYEIVGPFEVTTLWGLKTNNPWA